MSTSLMPGPSPAMPKVDQVYTGTGFDAARSFTNGTTTNNTTLTVTGGKIRSFLIIALTVNVNGTKANTNCSDSRATLQIETSVASAGSWTTRLNNTLAGGSSGNIANDTSEVKTIMFYYAPTASEIASGLDIRLTGSAIQAQTGGTCSASITNINTVLYLY